MKTSSQILLLLDLSKAPSCSCLHLPPTGRDANDKVDKKFWAIANLSILKSDLGIIDAADQFDFFAVLNFQN